jgi:hypothetical protein
MRVMIILAGLAGCTVAARTGDGVAPIATERCARPNLCPGGASRCGVEELLCPDGTTNCCSTNGTGIYTAEGGFAGIDLEQVPPVGQPPFVARKVMITHFVNAEGHVGFQAGAFDPDDRWMIVGDGQVVTADYGPQRGLGVAAVHEAATLPTWTLVGPAGPISVTGDALHDLRLHLAVPDGWGHSVAAVVDFAGPAGALPGVHAYGMRWRLDVPDAAWKPYCLDAERQADAAVFQQDIAVDPVVGQVTQPPPGVIVTLSCLRGAPATVYGWHYPYVGAQLFHFAAGIQMKRASYCADDRYYTTSGTPIELADDLHLQRGTGDSDHVRYLEAGWTPQGATCVNLANLRHSRLGFTGTCAGRALPACPAEPLGAPYLIAGPLAPAP